MTMQRYNYFKAVCADVRDYIKENINAADFSDREELEEHLNDVLWAEDSVTGNAPASTLSTLTKRKKTCATIQCH